MLILGFHSQGKAAYLCLVDKWWLLHYSWWLLTLVLLVFSAPTIPKTSTNNTNVYLAITVMAFISLWFMLGKYTIWNTKMKKKHFQEKQR